MNFFKIHIVEDDPWYGELLKYHLSLCPDYDVSLLSSGNECLENLHKKPDVICIDFCLPDMTGDKLLEQIKKAYPSVPVVVISSQEDISIVLNLIKSGAADYIIKDDNTKDLLWNSILKIRENLNLRNEVKELKEQLEQKAIVEKSIIGQSEPIQKVIALTEKAIKSTVNVSITGETGTGKEVIAKAIHFNSERKKKPFIAVNMAAIPKELIESELFGHEKGAFTGAITQKPGKFEEAQGGTIFLDEISELDLSLQSKILRVLQEREVVRVGGSEKIQLDIRLLTATQKDLAEEVKNGTFREDLYYRIIGLPITMPPLRERGNDILLFAKHFADDFAKSDKSTPYSFTKDATDKLMSYHFPGNIRELKAIIDLACVMSDGNVITDDNITFSNIRGMVDYTNIEKTLQEYNRDIIKHFLHKYSNNVILVAKKLDIGKSTIYKMIQQKEIYI